MSNQASCKNRHKDLHNSWKHPTKDFRETLKRDLEKQPVEPEFDQQEYIDRCEDGGCEICNGI